MVAKLSTGSGRKGNCAVCDHLNNEHQYETCTASGCRKNGKSARLADSGCCAKNAQGIQRVDQAALSPVAGFDKMRVTIK